MLRAGVFASLGLAFLSAPAAAAVMPFPKGYEAAYQAYVAALPASERNLSWAARLDEVSKPPRPLTMEGLEVLYIFACKNGDCEANNAHIFLFPDRKLVRAVLKLRGVSLMVGGAGPAETACAQKIDATGPAATSC